MPRPARGMPTSSPRGPARAPRRSGPSGGPSRSRTRRAPAGSRDIVRPAGPPRAGQDRALVLGDAPAGVGGTSLRRRLAGAPALKRLTIEVRKREPKSKDGRKRKQPRAARTAEVTVRAARVRLRGPARPGGKLADVDVNVVLVLEEAPPSGE